MAISKNITANQVKLFLDGGNRSWRSLLQGIAIAAFVAAYNFIQAGVSVDFTSAEALKRTGTALLFAVGFAVASFIHRTLVDPIAAIPSAVPPADPGQPDSETPELPKDNGMTDSEIAAEEQGEQETPTEVEEVPFEDQNPDAEVEETEGDGHEPEDPDAVLEDDSDEDAPLPGTRAYALQQEQADKQ